MKRVARLGWIALALMAFASACTLVADVDYRAPPSEPEPDMPGGPSDGSGGAAGSGG